MEGGLAPCRPVTVKQQLGYARRASSVLPAVL